jgi:hypothetical protein
MNPYDFRFDGDPRLLADRRTAGHNLSPEQL